MRQNAEQMRATLIREALEMDGVTIEDQVKLIKEEKELLEKRGHTWTGEERRGIPIHILNYMDERLHEHTERIESVFSRHTAEEMDRYNAILDKIAAGQKAAAERHETVMEVISHFNGKCKDVHSAFLKTPDGAYDFDGHRYDHDRRKKFGDWWEKVKGGIIVKIAEWGSLAFVIWVLHSLWESFIKGPGK